MNVTSDTAEKNTYELKAGLAQMLKGGVIMDVMNPEQAATAEAAGAVAVMALERIPSRIRQDGGVARMSDPVMIKEIKAVSSIPVMAKARIGHFVEAQILEACDIDFIDESEVLTPADELYHIDKHPFRLPFVCGACDLGQALRRIHEGAVMIRTKGEAGTGNIVEAVRHHRRIHSQIAALKGMDSMHLEAAAAEYRVPLALVIETLDMGRLPVVTFAAGGIATPADAALMMQLGCDGVFVGSGIFDAEHPEKMGKAVVEATLNYADPAVLCQVSENLGQTMKSQTIESLAVRYAERGD